MTKAAKITYTAEAEINGEAIRATRTSHRIYTHAAVRGPYSSGGYGVTFHGSAAQAARKNEYGPVALVVEVTSDRNYNDAAKAAAKNTPAPSVVEQPAPVEPEPAVTGSTEVEEPVTVGVEETRQSAVTHVVSVDGIERVSATRGKPEATQLFDILARENPASVVIMTTAKGREVRRHDGPNVTGKGAEGQPAEPVAPSAVEISKATDDVIKSLRKSTGMHREAWESLRSGSVEELQGEALRYLRDKSELDGRTLRIADWQAVYEARREVIAVEQPPAPVAPQHPAGAMIGYARVSTDDQDATLQVNALKAAGCIRVFVDKASGKSTEGRPELAAAIDYARPGDTLTVWKIDRASRSLIDLFTIVDGLAERGVKFRELSGFGEIDPKSPQGRLMLGMMGSFAEFERALIRERTLAGLATARAAGRVGGRPSVVTDDVLAALLARRAKGESVVSAAKALDISKSAAYRALAGAE